MRCGAWHSFERCRLEAEHSVSNSRHLGKRRSWPLKEQEKLTDNESELLHFLIMTGFNYDDAVFQVWVFRVIRKYHRHSLIIASASVVFAVVMLAVALLPAWV